MDSYQYTHWPFNHMVLLDHMTNWKIFTSITLMFMATKYGWVLTCNKELQHRKSHDPSKMWSYEVMWQIFTLSQGQWPQNTSYLPPSNHLPWGVSTHKITYLFMHVSCDVTWQIKNIKPPLSQCLWSPNF